MYYVILDFMFKQFVFFTQVDVEVLIDEEINKKDFAKTNEVDDVTDGKIYLERKYFLNVTFEMSSTKGAKCKLTVESFLSK